MRKDIGGQRFYETPVGLVPSVTTVLGIIDKGKAFKNWLIKQSQEEVDKVNEEACDLGTRVHEHIEHWIKCKIEGLRFNRIILPDEAPCMGAFWKWEKEHRVHYVKSEMFIYHPEGWAGTLDIIAYVDDKLSLIDIKTSKGFYDTMELQLAAYSMGYEYIEKEKLERRYILRLDKKTGNPFFRDGCELRRKYKGEDIDNFREEMYLIHNEAFRHFKSGWEWRNEKYRRVA